MSGKRKNPALARLRAENRRLRRQMSTMEALSEIQQMVNRQLQAANAHFGSVFAVTIGPSVDQRSKWLRFEHHFDRADIKPGQWEALRIYAHTLLDLSLADFEVKRGLKEVRLDLTDVRIIPEAFGLPPKTGR